MLLQQHLFITTAHLAPTSKACSTITLSRVLASRLKYLPTLLDFGPEGNTQISENIIFMSKIAK